ncbi:MAG: NAD(P)/FAD-dependent oxidoreductase [Candidatus Bathyarchaeota archaeon]|nr:NAD(P)/FAD-dependent oxidoreductase [Candidatus Bathyarchaeota archaeon]
MSGTGFSSNYYYDVVVAGAGPAGAMVSKKVAEKGLNVLLVEAQPSLGVKACGEGCSAETINDAEIPHLGKFICNKIKEIRIYAPDESKNVKVFGEGYIINKPLFLEELVFYAVKAGADVWVNSKVVDIQQTDTGFNVYIKRFGEILNVKCKAIAGCDGVNSIVARKFFDRSNYNVIPCIQYKMVNCKIEDPSRIETYLGRDVAPLGYAWFFPKDEHTANVGIGVRGGQAKPYLDKFIKTHPEKFRNARIVEVKGAPVPVSGEISKVFGDNIVICGDAAGQVIPLTGGGIHSSIVSGKVAGEVLAEHIKSGLSLDEYPKRYSYWSNRMRKSLRVLKALEKLSDQELNQLAEVLTGEDVLNLAGGLDIKKAAFKLLKHPIFALRLAKALME